MGGDLEMMLMARFALMEFGLMAAVLIGLVWTEK